MRKQFNTRLDSEVYAKLKLMATLEGKNMSKILDELVLKEFEERKEELEPFMGTLEAIKNNR